MGWKENKRKYDQRWIKENMKRIPLNLKNDEYEAFKAYVDQRGESMTGFIKRAMKEQMQRDLESPEASTDETTTEKE